MIANETFGLLASQEGLCSVELVNKFFETLFGNDSN